MLVFSWLVSPIVPVTHLVMPMRGTMDCRSIRPNLGTAVLSRQIVGAILPADTIPQPIERTWIASEAFNCSGY